jgi:hypothetical protein
MRPTLSTPSLQYYWHRHSWCRDYLYAAILVAAAALLGGCAGHPPLPMSDVVAMSKNNRGAEPIISKIRTSQTTYALRGSDFGKLREAGVAAPVLDYMQQSFVDDVDLLTRYWVTGESLGGCQRCYPQEVDLSGLATGEPVTQFPSPTAWINNQPQGMPSWYRHITVPLKGGGVSLDDIREMVTKGDSQEQILAALHTQGLESIIIQTDTRTVRTRPLTAISGSELAQLRVDGVPDPVLDAVQDQFLSQFVALERLRYLNIGKGSPQS